MNRCPWCGAEEPPFHTDEECVDRIIAERDSLKAENANLKLKNEEMQRKGGAVGVENIKNFCYKNRFEFVVGECGFGRPCVGIMNPATRCWVGYHDCNAAQSSRPENAYHKDDYLCVLVQDGDYNKAIPQLEAWIGGIVKGGYRVGENIKSDGLAALVAGHPVVQKALFDPI